jgi:hypothetical protein
MLHGYRTDLNLNCLVNSKKGRNLYLYLLAFLLILISKYKNSIPHESQNCKLRLNRYGFYIQGFKCDILIKSKSCVILKNLANL